MTALAPSLPLPRLVRAEVLKLRKRRGLVAITACLTIGAALAVVGSGTVIGGAQAFDDVHHDQLGTMQACKGGGLAQNGGVASLELDGHADPSITDARQLRRNLDRRRLFAARA